MIVIYCFRVFAHEKQAKRNYIQATANVNYFLYLFDIVFRSHKGSG